MTTSSGEIAGIALIAGLVLQACATPPPLIHTPELAADHRSATFVPVERVPSLRQNLDAMLERAHTLDAEVTRLLSEAASLEVKAKSPSAFASLFGSQLSSANDFFLNEAASRRARAAQLSSEASELHNQLQLLGEFHVDFSGTEFVTELSGFCCESSSIVRNRDRMLRGESIDLEPGHPKYPANAKAPDAPVSKGGSVLTGPSPIRSSSGHKPANTPALSNVPYGEPPMRHPNPAASFAAESGKIDGLVQGSAGVSAPSTAKERDSFYVFLRVSPKKLAVLLQELKDEFPENQTVQGKPGIKLTPRMTASVSGFGFEVTPKDGQAQAVSATDATTWTWEVKAIEQGLHTLTFNLSGTLNIEGTEVARNFYHYRQRVQVKVDPRGFIERNWKWLVTTLVIPAIGTAWAVLRKPKEGGGMRQPSLAEMLRERRRLRAIS